ncbi:putative protein kinase [Trypanosoma grayi]|uniref:putative protein kinase n=1 Tax=Trypanosoma grayi TaxID=71804 RepID=UPI0004F413D4|nr:putative protein kinase [Trypanosoma grayi]KEG14732.1 putative protein kinase [Trypanosoma grayi]
MAVAGDQKDAGQPPQGDYDDDTGIILLFPPTPLPPIGPLHGSMKHGHNLFTRCLSSSNYGIPTSLANGLVSPGVRPMTVKFEEDGKHKLHPIAVIREEPRSNAWLCYTPLFRNCLVVVINCLNSSFWSDDALNYAKAIHSLSNGDGICRFYGMTPRLDVDTSTTEASSMEPNANFGVSKSSKTEHSFFRLPTKWCTRFKASNPHHCVNTAVFEYFPGASLFDVMEDLTFHIPLIIVDRLGLDRKRPLSDHVISHLLTGVLNGLSSLHACGVAHGSLRPSAVLLSPDLKVCLYSIGFCSVDNDVDVLKWCAPEVALSGVKKGWIGAGSEAGDIWAFGCLAYYLATYKVPFHGNDDATSLMSCLKLLQFGGPNKSNPLSDSNACGPQTGSEKYFVDLSAIENEMLRDLVGQCIKLVSFERPSILEIQEHRYFKGRSDDILHFRQREVRCFMERARSEMNMGEFNVDSLVSPNYVKHENPSKAVPVAARSVEEIDEVVLSAIVRDLTLWYCTVGSKRRRLLASTPSPQVSSRLGSSHRSSHFHELPCCDGLPGTNDTTLSEIPELSKLTASALSDAMTVGLDCREFVLTFLSQVDTDEDFLHALEVFARHLCSRDIASEGHCSVNSSDIVTNDTIEDKSGIAPLFSSVEVGQKGKRVGPTLNFVWPTVPRATANTDSTQKGCKETAGVMVDGGDMERSGFTSASMGPNFDNCALEPRSSTKTECNETVVEQGRVQEEGASQFSPIPETTPITRPIRNPRALSTRFVASNRGERLVIIVCAVAFLCVIVVSVVLSATLSAL